MTAKYSIGGDAAGLVAKLRSEAAAQELTLAEEFVKEFTKGKEQPTSGVSRRTITIRLEPAT